MISRFISCLFLSLGFGLTLHAQDAAPAPAPTAVEATPTADTPPREFVDQLREAGITVVSGPAVVPLGKVAEVKLPAKHHAVAADSLERFYELTQNVYGGNEVGVVIGPENWMLFFDYEDVGYVKDDEKDQLDAPKLLASMQESQIEANKFRAKQGWDEMRLAGWAHEPHYDPQTNHLKWAIQLTSSADNYAKPWINENIRLLGRGGVMNVTLVTAPESFQTDARTVDALLATNFSYVAGQRYAEFRPGDKIAKYGLAALVLGGAGAAAYKLGFLQKFWKALAIGVVAVLATVRKLWNKITGRNPS